MQSEKLIFGIHAVMAIIRNDPANVLELWIDRNRSDERMRSLLDAANHQGVQVLFVRTKALVRRVGRECHQGVVARYRAGRELDDTDFPQVLQSAGAQPLLLVLDGVTDPHNLGACLRTAEAAGVHAVIVPKDRAARRSPVVDKVASGAAQRVPYVTVTNLVRSLHRLQALGIWLYGTDSGAKHNLFDVNLARPLALVMGGEAKGLRRLTRERCDELVRLPMAGQAESLNVAVAAGICLYEALRQRKPKA